MHEPPRRAGALVVLAIAGSGFACGTPAAPADPVTQQTPSFPATCFAIARDLEALGRTYPQLAGYRAAAQQRPCKISYGFRTHPAERPGGWAGSVPNPDDDGVWFYIGIWDPDDPAEAGAQINTQPVLPPWSIGERRVTFLMLEGKQTASAREAIVGVLERHGMK